MAPRHVNTLSPGDPFRDWLVEEVVRHRLRNKKCSVNVFKYNSSHTVCRYQFEGENLSVMAKFFAEPTGRLKDYNPYKGMMNEYRNLKKAATTINVAKPLAINKKFNCVLVTEYIPGRSLASYFDHQENLYEKLTKIAHVLRQLHENTKSSYNKKNEFRNYHEVLDHLKLDHATRESFNKLLGQWWYSSLLNREHGCMVHRDVTPSNYIFYKDEPYALDFESSWLHAHPVRDLGILAAELKNEFELHRGGGWKAEPYIGHFLWEYSRDEKDFNYVTKILPFFMSIGLLRSARLHEGDYRNYLIKEAGECLKAINK
ncbi:MAG: phosphotransferase [Methanosarcina sp.]|nr:phosphotransferase [Methanosarcina sp.]MDD3316414.1 phosphotransferase [Methanosarcina sp.]MDD4306730.1 phosphotransferase [Methanosarcina sp.]MDD4621246.1 phosphotransferase [Methanosarcina sp.]